jgi:hypothetical protein
MQKLDNIIVRAYKTHIGSHKTGNTSNQSISKLSAMYQKRIIAQDGNKARSNAQNLE